MLVAVLYHFCAERCLLTITTTKFQSQWLAVEMDAMGTLSLIGATSVQ